MSWKGPSTYPGAGQRWYYARSDDRPYLVLDTFTGTGSGPNKDRIHVELILRGLHPNDHYLYSDYHDRKELSTVIAELQAKAEMYLMEALL